MDKLMIGTAYLDSFKELQKFYERNSDLITVINIQHDDTSNKYQIFYTASKGER